MKSVTTSWSWPVRRGPLDNMEVESGPESPPAEAPLAIGERRMLGKLMVHGDPGADGLREAAARCLESPLPIEPNTISVCRVRALWFGPKQWLLVTQPGAEHSVATSLRTALSAESFALVDVSDQMTVITIAGNAVPDVMARLCSLDLDAWAMSPRRCARTVVARLPVTVDMRNNQPCFDLYVESTVAPHLWRSLHHVGRRWQPVVFCPPASIG